MSTIPASALVNVIPSVLAAAGAALDMTGLVLTNNRQVPIGAVQSFPDADSVSDYFGATSQEATLAGIYFNGFTGSTALPGAMLFAQYPVASVSAYLRGGDVSDLTLAELQAFNGTLTVTIDGVVKTGSPNLAAATSFSNAGVIIATALAINGVQGAAFTGSIAGTVLTVSAVASGALALNDEIVGAGVTADTYITSFGTGTGGTGTYNLSASMTVSSESMTATTPPVQYDSVSGGFVIYSGTTGASSTIGYGTGAMATNLLLTLALGAVTSQGSIASVPAAFMNAVVATTDDWVTFMTAFDPDASGHAVKQAFAEWKDTQNNRFAYVCFDTDVTVTTTLPATASLGYALENNADSGTFLIYAPDATTGAELAAFVCGLAGSINFEQTNGRAAFAYRWQAGLDADVSDASIAANLLGNGYNFGGAYGAANQNFVFLQNGQITGPFAWADSYINQIQLNNACQVALLTMLSNTLSAPYNPSGYSMIESALAAPIAAAQNFGSIAPGDITAAQAVAVNSGAGADVAATLQTQGYYLQVLPASAVVRAARGSPPCTLWYLDRGSIQTIDLASIAVQ